MGTTPKKNLRYPEGSALANTLHTQIKNLAEDVDNIEIGSVGTIPATSIAMSNGWSGSVSYAKFGNVVTVWASGTKASWGINDNMLPAGSLPVGIRPVSGFGGFNVGYSIAAANDNSPRNWWISDDGSVKAAAGGTGSSWGSATYQVPSMESSAAISSGGEAPVTLGSGITNGAETIAYLRGGDVAVRVNIQLPASLAAGTTLFTLPPGYRPAVTWYDVIPIITGVESTIRVVVNTSGAVTLAVAGPAGVPVMRGSIKFPAAISATAAKTMVDSGWVSYASDFPNIYHTSQWSKYRRVGNTVTIKQMITLTSTFTGAAYITLPFPFAAGTPLGTSGMNLGRVRALRSGVAWHVGEVYAELLAGRAQICEPIGNGSIWTGTFPATWQANDKYWVELEYEAAPL